MNYEKMFPNAFVEVSTNTTTSGMQFGHPISEEYKTSDPLQRKRIPGIPEANPVLLVSSGEYPNGSCRVYEIRV